MAESILAKMAVILSADSVGFKKDLAQSEGALTSFVRKVQSVASTLGVGFGVQTIVQGIFSAVNSVKELEQQLSTVRAITGATGKEFDALRDSALKLGGSTQFSAKEVAELQTEFGRLGFSTAEILQASKATILLATATGEDLAKSADTAGSVVRAFGLDASETQRVVDVMAESFNRSALGLSNFTEAIKYVAPISKSAGISLEETTALLGTLADAGIRGSQAGTSLRKIITDLAKDGRPLSVRLKELADRGLSFAEANDEVGRTAYASLLILAENIDKTEGLTKALGDAKGAAERTAEVVGDNLTGDLKRLGGAYDSLIQNIGEGDNVLRDFVKALTAVLQALNSQDGALGNLIGKYIRFATVIPRTLFNGIEKIANIFSGNIELTKEQVRETEAELGKLIQKAKLEGNQKDVIQYTQLLAGLASKYGLVRDKAVEYKEAKATDGDAENAKDAIVTLESLKNKLKELEQARATTNVKDTASLDKYAAQIAKLKEQIEEIEGTDKRRATGIELVREKLAKLNDEYDRAGISNEKRRQEIALEIQALQGLLKNLEAARAFKLERIDLGDTLNFFNTDEFLSDKFLKDINDRFKKFKLVLKKNTEEVKAQVIDFTGPIQSAIGSIADALGRAVVDSGDFGKDILKVVINFAKQLGEILIGAGVAMLALKTVVNNPAGAIIAGAALLAIAGAAQAAVEKSQSNLNTSAASSATRDSISGNIQNTGRSQIELVGEVKLRGQDIYISLNNYLENNKGTRYYG